MSIERTDLDAFHARLQTDNVTHGMKTRCTHRKPQRKFTNILLNPQVRVSLFARSSRQTLWLSCIDASFCVRVDVLLYFVHDIR